MAFSPDGVLLPPVASVPSAQGSAASADGRAASEPLDGAGDFLLREPSRPGSAQDGERVALGVRDARAPEGRGGFLGLSDASLVAS